MTCSPSKNVNSRCNFETLHCKCDCFVKFHLFAVFYHLRISHRCKIIRLFVILKGTYYNQEASLELTGATGNIYFLHLFSGNSVKICRCIAASFYPNAAYLHPSGVYRSVRGQQDFYIHPTSVLYNVQQPQW